MEIEVDTAEVKQLLERFNEATSLRLASVLLEGGLTDRELLDAMNKVRCILDRRVGSLCNVILNPDNGFYKIVEEGKEVTN
jgi:hypothetical protein